MLPSGERWKVTQRRNYHVTLQARGLINLVGSFHHKGNRIQQSSGTSERVKAEEYEAKLRSSLWEQDRLGAKPIYKWDDAVVRYLHETQHKASQSSDLSRFRWVDKYLRGVELHAIKRDFLDKILTAKKAEGWQTLRLIGCWKLFGLFSRELATNGMAGSCSGGASAA